MTISGGCGTSPSATRSGGNVRALVVIACVVGCASPRPWSATYTVATLFEGERIEIASGHQRLVSCETTRGDSKDYPLWGCTDSEYRLNQTYVRVGARKPFQLWIPGHITDHHPVPRLQSVTVRRLSSRLLAFDLRAKNASWGTASLVCLQSERGCNFASIPVDVPPGASLETARARAIARGWRSAALDAFFGPSPSHRMHAVTSRDWSYLDRYWTDIEPELRDRALADAIDHDQESFLQRHWNDLAPSAMQRAIALFVEHDRYAWLAEDTWWARLPPAAQQQLLELALDAIHSLERKSFLERRARKTADPRITRALERH